MTLCTLCQTVPFDSLPSMPGGMFGMSRVADSHLMPELHWRTEGTEQVQMKESIGFPWHESLDVLADSARAGCCVCTLVQSGVDIWISSYRQAESNYPGWAQFYKESQLFPDGQKLWLTKRTGGGIGFAVLVRAPTKKSSFHLLAAVNLSVEARSDLASKFPLRPMAQFSGSKESLDVAASFVSNCFEKHDRCAREVTQLPSRVLDVGSAGDTIKMINCPTGMTGKYICLSHCWGSSETLSTTHESYESMSGIAISELPKTFLDTVVIARHLGIPYVWIDSLCITQEDQPDWARESGRMTDVYSNAYLVVAANHAKDSDGGCFHERPSRPQTKVVLPGLGEVVFQLIFLEDESINGTEFREEPLTGRGWALQERLLARRVLHYNARQMFFECSHGVVGEDGSSTDKRYSCDLIDLAQQKSRNPEFKPEFSVWNNVLWTYGNRKFTKASDKLPAITGIAKLFSPGLGTHYVAGLWSDHLIEGLAWQSIGNRGPMSTTEYIAPTWSWANFSGIAATGLRGKWKHLAKVEDWHVELQNEENPFGQVKNAWISIHAPIAELRPGSKELMAHEIKLKEIGRTPHPRFRTPYFDSDRGGIVSPDHEDVLNSGVWQKWDLQVIILCGLKNENQKIGKVQEQDNDGGDAELNSLSTFYGLVVIRAGEGENLTLKRVGWMFVEQKEARKMVLDKSCWKIVTLV